MKRYKDELIVLIFLVITFIGSIVAAVTLDNVFYYGVTVLSLLWFLRFLKNILYDKNDR